MKTVTASNPTRSTIAQCSMLHGWLHKDNKKKMKTIIKISVILCISYAILMLLLDAAYSLLSLSQQSNISALIDDKLIPYIISIASMIYCITHIIRHWTLNSHSCSPHN